MTELDPFIEAKAVSQLLLYRMAVITRSTSLPLVRVFEGEFGITRRHWHILGMLAEHGSLSASELAQHCWLDAPRISRAVAGLVQRRLVQRQPGPGRLRRLVPTTEGLALHQRALHWVAGFNAELASVLSPAERQVLDKLLQRLQLQAQTLSQRVAQQTPTAPRHKGRG